VMKEDKEQGGHVSTFELDVLWASGQKRDAALEAHLAECERCAAYLASLDARRDAGAPVTSLPARAAVANVAQSRRARGRRGWVLPVLGAVALAASVPLLMRTSRLQRDSYVATKGTPAVEILIHRDQDTRVWDGHSPIRAGDTLALRVACEGLDTAAVAAPAETSWTRLSEAPCPSAGAPLPFTLRVDDEPGDEKLAVVLSHGTMDAAALDRAVKETQRTGDVWVVTFVLPKAR
jgi:hypothetical protein